MICGTETDFFHFLAQANEIQLGLEKNWPFNAVDFLFQQVPGKGRQSIPEEYGLDREEVISFLNNRDPSINAILSAITEQYSKKRGKQRWIEKTPNHILYVEEIRRAFPDAAIIRILRDPRDVALSIIKTPWDWAPRTLSGGLEMWRYMDDCSSSFFRSDDNSCTIKYEELISDPHTVLSGLCEFLGERFESGMLNKEQSYDEVNLLAEPWKRKVAEKADTSRLGVWKRELDEQGKMACISIIGDILIKYGYECNGESLLWGSLFPENAFLRYPMLVDWLVKRKVRIWPNGEETKPDMRVIAGSPERDNWLGDSQYQRVRKSLALLIDALAIRIRGIPMVFFKANTGKVEGIISRFIIRSLSYLGSVAPVESIENPDTSWRINLVNYPKLSRSKYSPEDKAEVTK
jgi:hypothetical protein